MRLYWILIRFLRLINQLYFVEVRATGREHVPDSGPVILAANHPSSILDSILLATVFRWLGAVPIYRPHETGDYAARNLEIFDQVYELLDRGGCIGIFPEGRNSPPTRIGPLKKGAARMALNAEARNDYSLGLIIVPVGVNFENRDFLMAAVLLRFGQPIRVADYADLHRTNPEQACAQLTRDIKESLGREAVHIEDDRLRETIDDLNEVFGERLGQRFALDDDGAGDDSRRRPLLKRWFWQVMSWYRRATPESSRAFERRMHSRQHIHQVLASAWQRNPRQVLALQKHLDRYKDHLRQTELNQAMRHSFDQPVRQRMIRLRMTVYAVLMAPIALFGLIHNAIPYLLTKKLAGLTEDQAVRAFTYFGLGVISFGAAYGLLGLGLWRHSGLSLPWTLAYIATLPPTGFAALHYRRNVLVYRERILVRTIFFNRRELVELLRRERLLLEREFSALARRYDSSEART